MVEWGEDVSQTAARELAEETGFRMVSVQRLQGVYSSPDRDPRTHAVTITFIETREVGLFERDQLPFGELAHDHDRQLRDFLAGRTVIA
mgnify:CR=1 FL=1